MSKVQGPSRREGIPRFGGSLNFPMPDVFQESENEERQKGLTSQNLPFVRPEYQAPLSLTSANKGFWNAVRLPG